VCVPACVGLLQEQQHRGKASGMGEASAAEECSLARAAQPHRTTPTGIEQGLLAEVFQVPRVEVRPVVLARVVPRNLQRVAAAESPFQNPGEPRHLCVQHGHRRVHLSTGFGEEGRGRALPCLVAIAEVAVFLPVYLRLGERWARQRQLNQLVTQTAIDEVIDEAHRR
jgi:hypothetical protein